MQGGGQNVAQKITANDLVMLTKCLVVIAAQDRWFQL